MPGQPSRTQLVDSARAGRAIAIPTFLSLTNGSKSGSAESDLTTAAVDEAGCEAVNGDFDGTVTGSTTATAADNVLGSSNPPGMSSVDPGLTWTYGNPATTVVPLVLAGTAGRKTIWSPPSPRTPLSMFKGSPHARRGQVGARADGMRPEKRAPWVGTGEIDDAPPVP